MKPWIQITELLFIVTKLVEFTSLYLLGRWRNGNFHKIYLEMKLIGTTLEVNQYYVTDSL